MPTPRCAAPASGAHLIEAVYKAADARGVPPVYWLTQDFNATARRLYDRIGNSVPLHQI